MYARRKLSNQGYTLMEMVVVISIISLCVLGGIVGYRGVRNYQWHTAVMAVEVLIYEAQHTAHLQNKHTLIQVGEQNIQWIEEVHVIKQVELPKGMKAELTTQEDLLRFNKDLAPTKGGTIILRDDVLRKIKRLTIRPVTGKITRYDER